MSSSINGGGSSAPSQSGAYSSNYLNSRGELIQNFQKSVKSNAGNSNTKNQDSILMYCSYFTYGKEQAMTRRLFCESIKPSEMASKLETMECKYPFNLSSERNDCLRYLGALERIH
jgi:hypothetical protein